MYWRPPASLRSRSPTSDWTTLPSCDAISPKPTPRTAIATANEVSSICGSIVLRSMITATSTKASPALTIARGAQRAERRAPMPAVISIVIETGSIRRPVSNASKPWTTCR